METQPALSQGLIEYEQNLNNVVQLGFRRPPPWSRVGQGPDRRVGNRMDQKIDLLLGRRLRRRRRLMGLTQSQLAEKVGVRFQQVQKYEAGANRISAARLWLFCQALEVDVAYFFEGLPSTHGDASAVHDDSAELLARPESIDLIRVFHQLDERPRQRLLALARSLNSHLGAA